MTGDVADCNIIRHLTAFDLAQPSPSTGHIKGPRPAVCPIATSLSRRLLTCTECGLSSRPRRRHGHCGDIGLGALEAEGPPLNAEAPAGSPPSGLAAVEPWNPIFARESESPQPARPKPTSAVITKSKERMFNTPADGNRPPVAGDDRQEAAADNRRAGAARDRPAVARDKPAVAVCSSAAVAAGSRR